MQRTLVLAEVEPRARHRDRKLDAHLDGERRPVDGAADLERAFSWSPGLFAARAAVLEELGRLDEAAQWQRRAEIAEDVIGARDADSETLLIEEIDEVELDDDEIDDLDPDGEDAVAPAAAESESDAEPEPEPEPELATEIAPEPAPASVQDEVDEILAEAGIDDAAGDAPDAESTRG